MATSGAAYPGVPARGNKYSSADTFYANPKSAITKFEHSLEVNNMFAGFKSRCIIPRECKYANPSSYCFIILLISSLVNSQLLEEI